MGVATEYRLAYTAVIDRRAYIAEVSADFSAYREAVLHGCDAHIEDMCATYGESARRAGQFERTKILAARSLKDLAIVFEHWEYANARYLPAGVSYANHAEGFDEDDAYLYPKGEATAIWGNCNHHRDYGTGGILVRPLLERTEKMDALDAYVAGLPAHVVKHHPEHRIVHMCGSTDC